MAWAHTGLVGPCLMSYRVHNNSTVDSTICNISSDLIRNMLKNKNNLSKSEFHVSSLTHWRWVKLVWRIVAKINGVVRVDLMDE